MTDVLSGLLIPFAGTTLGAACVLFVKKEMNVILQRALTGFAAGVMVAASVWSLLLPALSQASGMGRWSFVPAVVGFWAGIMFLFLLDNIIPHLHSDTEQAEGPRANLKKTTMLVLAVTLHNIPAVSYTHLRAHETDSYLVCRLLLEKKNKKDSNTCIMRFPP